MQSGNLENLGKIVHAMEGRPVLVIGDIMLDCFVYGEVERISPESPVPILSITREDKMLGGAGNALSSLHGLKTKAHIITIVGQDDPADQVEAKIKAMGIPTDGLIRDASRPTIVKTRFLAGHQQLLRSDYEKKSEIDTSTAKRVWDKITHILPQMQVVLVSDYGKGLLGPVLLGQIIALAKQHNIPVVIDPKGNDYTKYKGAFAITPNKKELSEASGHMAVKTDQDVLDAAKKIIAECEIENVIATRSADGMSIIEGANTDDPLHLRTTAKDVFDVSGAGDVVIATICAALSAGADLLQAGGLANIAGGIAVSKVGTTPIRAKELIEALADEDVAYKTTMPASGAHTAGQRFIAPLFDDEEALEQVRRWRARGLKVGFTNGCFDILHHGHVSYLNEARGHCDRLIIGLNRDASVRALKGADRPVHDEQARASVLGALAAVDMVVLFGSDKAGGDQTANALVSILQPDLYFKGGDYKAENIPEAKSVHHYGGEVKILSIFSGHSTTFSIQKMRDNAA